VSTTTTGHNYGVGLLAILVASGAGIIYYQMYYVPEIFATPDVDEHILHPVKSTTIEMIMGSANADQQDNYVPKLVQIQLTIDNHVIWLNVDETAHTVTPTAMTKASLLILIVDRLVQQVLSSQVKHTIFYLLMRHQMVRKLLNINVILIHG